MNDLSLIFDFGNVIGFFDFGKAAARLGPRIGLSGRAFLDRLDLVGYDALHRTFECGEIDAARFHQRFIDLMGLEMTRQEFIPAWADIFTPNLSITPIIADLKAQGYRLILGSNTNSIHADHFRGQFASILADFDHLVLSYEIGVMKPDADFYRACAAAAGRRPDSCVFIDDLAENIAGAEAIGMQGIVYSDTTTLEDGFTRLGIDLRPIR